MRWYRWGVAGFALVLLIIAGVMTIMENPEAVLQEKSVKVSDVYSFSFLTQETEKVGAANNSESVKDSAIRSVVDSDEVYYSDSFFLGSNREYDHELAKASLALSMTAFKKEHVNEFLSDLGYDGTVFYRYDQHNDEDRVALAISHKNNIIAIVIRGGKYGDEWGSNGRVGYDGESFGYHYGFHKAAEDAIIQLKEYAADNDIVLQDSKVWITGFSRGGAVANVMGAMLTGTDSVAGSQSSIVTRDSAGQGYDGLSKNPVIIRSENLFDYTFASPNTVSEDLITDDPVSGLYNIVNPLDIVTRLPMNASGISKTSKGKTVRYNWDYTKYGTTLNLPTGTESSQLQVVQLLENALAFATRSESQYVERTQDQVIIPALKKTLGRGADVSKRNIGYVLVDSLPGVATFLKNEVNKLDLKAQIYVAGILSGQKSIRLEKEHWPETYWGWMAKVDGLE